MKDDYDYIEFLIDAEMIKRKKLIEEAREGGNIQLIVKGDPKFEGFKVEQEED